MLTIEQVLELKSMVDARAANADALLYLIECLSDSHVESETVPATTTNG